MAISAVFYDLAKLPDSTKTPEVPPVTGPYQTLNVVLKERTSVLTPTLIVELPTNTTMPQNVNYVIIEQFKRNYFIVDWVAITNKVWECRCRVDVLGTYRTEILTSTQFVERAEKNSNGRLIDKLSVTTGVVDTAVNSASSIWGDSVSIIVGIGGGTPSYYAFSPGNFTSFLKQVFSDDYIDQILPSGWEETYPQARVECNPLQYISSARLYLLPAATFSGLNVGPIDVGWATIYTSATKLADHATVPITRTLEVPTHPQAATYPYANRPPFSEIGVYYPPFGDIPIDAGVAIAGGTLRCEVEVDPQSGFALLTVYGGSPGIILGSASAQVGIEMQLSQIASQGYGTLNAITDASGIAMDIASAVTGAMADDGMAVARGVSGAINGFSSTIQNYVGSQVPKSRTIGGVGVNVGFSQPLYCYGRFERFLPPPNHYAGRPLYTTAQLQSLQGGFCKCFNAEVGTQGTVQETEQIVALLNGGVYLE